MKLTNSKISEFHRTVRGYYKQHGRDLPWRTTHDPYKIMVSEIMLQQTQVPRVLTKYQEFLDAFPTIESLSRAELKDVLQVWSGLGYNRRAKYLHQAAQRIMAEHNGRFPSRLNVLTNLPGIGVNTAGAILAYAFNQPTTFLETNIRTVFIHHFFADRAAVSDKELLPLLEQTIDTKNPREFYWGLMDYGTYLKKVHGNASKRSKHYAKQSVFEGSKRQIRGKVLKLLLKKPYNLRELQQVIADERLESVLEDLKAEQLLMHKDHAYTLG